MPDYNAPGAQNTPMRGMIIQNQDGSISPPHNIITTIWGARAIYQTYRTAHLKRIALYAQIKGLTSGNPPYDPIELQTHGLSHIANFNDMSPRSKIRKASLGYWNLLYNTENLCKFVVNEDSPESTRIADTLADEWTKVVKKWKPFSTVFNTLIDQLVHFGVSPVFWRDERDWRWRPIELQRFFVAQQAPTNTDELTCVCVESVFNAQYLYECYLQFKNKKFHGPSGEQDSDEDIKLNNESRDIPEEKLRNDESPWNPKALEQLLLFYANATVKPGSLIKDFMDLQQRIQEGDFIWESVFSDGFRIVSLFYKEYDGKISHYMFDRNFDTSYESGFLYFVDRQYETFEEALVIFTKSPGEFTIHSNRGVGHEIFSLMQAIMQLNCATVDMAKIAATPMFKTLNVGGKEFQQIRIFPGTACDIGSAEFVQTNFGANIQQNISASQYFNQLADINVANAGEDPGVPDRDQVSMGPAQQRAQSFREFSIPRNDIQHFYGTFDTVIQNMVTKMIHSEFGYPGYEFAKEWIDNCINKGVPEEIFETRGVKSHEMPPQLSVKAARVAGDGSTLGTIMGLEALQPVASEFTPEGIKEYARQYIRAVQGPEFVSTYISDDPQPGGEVSLAAVENGIMRLAESPVVSPTNDQQTHIVTHFALINDTINQVKQQQTTPLDADKIFSVAIPHTQEHIQLFSKSIFAKQFMQQIEKPWKEIQRFAANNRTEAGKMVEAQIRQKQQDEQQTQQVMNDAQRKDFTAQADVKRADFKVQSQVQRAGEANVNRAEVMHEKVQRDAANQRLKITLNAQAKGGEAPGAETYPDEPLQGEAPYMNPPRTQQQQLQAQPLDELRSELNTLNGKRPAAFDIEGP